MKDNLVNESGNLVNESGDLVNDCISRRWLMECVDEGWIKFDTEKDENTFVHLVRDIAPPVTPQPQPKMGRWIWQTEDIYRCSECGNDIRVKEVMNVPQYVCCPLCGAKMQEVEE